MSQLLLLVWIDGVFGCCVRWEYIVTIIGEWCDVWSRHEFNETFCVAMAFVTVIEEIRLFRRVIWPVCGLVGRNVL
jgi:hypothetical protein